jgi:predicted RNase H-like nuclease (RuvC/YqgF family)
MEKFLTFDEQLVIKDDEIEQLQAENAALKAELAKQQLCIEKMRIVLDDVEGNINPERGFADELERDVNKILSLQPDLSALREHDAEVVTRMAEKCAHFFINGGSIHPDITFEQMNEAARAACHSTAQTLCFELMDEAERIRKGE